MDFLQTILTPFEWLVSMIMVLFHDALTFIGLPAASGITWTLSIIGLVLVIRAALIPVFVKQIKAQRGMQALQPDMKKLQAKYKGKTDQLSRQAMAQEQMALYKEHGTNPFSACLPMLIQMPFFFSLFRVLSGVAKANAESKGIGGMSHAQVAQFDHATIFGAPLSAAFLPQLQGGDLSVAVVVLSLIMIIAMIASQFITQKQIMSKNMSEEAMQGPFMKQQKMMLYVLPLVFGIGGVNFPIGVLIYWTTTNIWTMGQQFFVIRRMPTPGSPAYKEYQKRREAKGLPLLGASKKAIVPEVEEVPEPKGQRSQPQRKNRKKK
ncbi:membrane protein insertase YidC [Arthrobacter wenxiniae]|jgi:YidC/Oxa1 family membrane protein insertase|uniref:Membrane protein insertase YidC n=1 Tax=Arthrobacter wenxiniae TaxID=2713570 RepID=A0A7Y7IK27_9MICC|nr:membrane protein insertase YidC [Arthrobacter wenxiniae]NVM96585.1 membrane protein insertase YidC [Arthrobacter wenxiniae]